MAALTDDQLLNPRGRFFSLMAGSDIFVLFGLTDSLDTTYRMSHLAAGFAAKCR
jgi:hypothetical protein